MKTIQFDECVNAKRLHEACQAEGKINARRFPRELADKATKDHQMLRWWQTTETSLLTSDEHLPYEHAVSLAANHKGIVVFCNAGRETMNTSGKIALLAGLKKNLPEWHELNLDNAIIEVWGFDPSRDISIFVLAGGREKWRTDLQYGDVDWKEKLLQSLAQANLEGKTSLGGGENHVF